MFAAARARLRGRSPRPSAAISRAAAARRTRGPAFTSATRGGAPSQPLEGANPSHPDLHSFDTQQFTLDLQVTAITAERPARRYHAMAGDARIGAGTHDGADRARRPRVPRKRGDVAVGRDAPGRDPAHRRQHARAKLTQRPTMILARSVNPPRSCSSY